MTPTELTVKEAIEQGYTHFGYDTGDFQHLSRLEDVSKEDFDGHFDIVLADKEAYYITTTADRIMSAVSDDICCQDDYKDDTGTVEDALKEMDGWGDFADKINAKLKEHPYWHLTKIKLLP